MPRIKITDQYALVKRIGSAKWYLEWREQGQKQRRSTGTDCLDAARIAARDIILKTAIIENQPQEVMPIAVVLERFYLQHATKLASKTTAKRAVDVWREFWGEATVTAIKPGKLDEFIDWMREGKGFSQNYTRRTLAVGKAALNRAWKRQEITSVPYVPLLPAGHSFPHRASNEQLAKFLNAIPEHSHLWEYCMIRLNTLCRGDAGLDLCPAQVDFQDNLIKLNPDGRQQTKKYRPIVPLTRTLRNVLKDLHPDGPYVNWKGKKIDSIRKTWTEIRVRAGLPAHFSPKILRHSVATEMRRRAVPGWEVSGALGHVGGESHRTTEVYATFDPAYLSHVRKALDAWMTELSDVVPRLRGVSPVSAKAKSKTARSSAERAVATYQMVELIGIEPMTSTMPL